MLPIPCTDSLRSDLISDQSSFDNCGPVFQKLPEFLARTKYQAITDSAKCVLQPAFNINVPAFIWLQQNPARFATFQQYMMQQREGMPTWLTVYPVGRETKEWDPDRPVFVDVGGGLGHQCVALKAKYPDLRGRVILQDLPHAIEAALSTPGVQNMVHDFFSPQPVKGKSSASARSNINEIHTYEHSQGQSTTTCATSSTIIPTTSAWWS